MKLRWHVPFLNVTNLFERCHNHGTGRRITLSLFISILEDMTMPYRVVLLAALVLLIQQTESVDKNGFTFNAIDSASIPFTPENFITYGSGFVNGSGFILTQQGDPFGTIILYNDSLPLGTGLTTDFWIQVRNCDNGTYGGADGFAFVIFPRLPEPFYVPGGSNIGITTIANVAVVGFILVDDILTVCAVDSTSDLGRGSLKDDTTHCIQNTTMNNVLRNIRCNSTHHITIEYHRPGDWKIYIDQNEVYSFTKDIISILDWESDYTGYVGFSGGVGAGWMEQRIVVWDFSPNTGSPCMSTCAANANCDFSTNVAICSCPNGFSGDGYKACIPMQSSANIVPILECYEKYGNNAYEAFYGYDNKENTSVVIPHGVNNQLYGFSGTFNSTELFMPGRSSFYPANAFSVPINLPNSDPVTITWHLGNYEVSFSTDDTTKRCSQDLLILLRFTTGRQLSANETILILDQLHDLLEVSFGRISIRNVTYNPLNAKRQTGPDLAQLALEISGTNSTTSTEPRASQVVQQLINASSNTTRMNEVINPDPDNPDPDRNFVGVKTTSSGTETSGQVVLQPTSPSASSNPIAVSGAPYGLYVSTTLLSTASAISWLLLVS